MGKKQPNTICTTISVPRDLKRRMGKVKEAINWSALACQAFREKLAEIDLRKKETTIMSSVVERMRAAKRRSDSQDFQDGFDTGQDWANGQGEPAELERLESLWERLSSDQQYGWEWWFSQGDSESTFSELMDVLFPTHQPDVEEMFGRYFDVIPEGEPSGEYLRGFAEGALEVWVKVKSQL